MTASAARTGGATAAAAAGGAAAGGSGSGGGGGGGGWTSLTKQHVMQNAGTGSNSTAGTGSNNNIKPTNANNSSTTSSSSSACQPRSHTDATTNSTEWHLHNTPVTKMSKRMKQKHKAGSGAERGSEVDAGAGGKGGGGGGGGGSGGGKGGGAAGKSGETGGKAKANATSHIPCKFFMQGTCSMGKSCLFSHDVEQDSAQICKYYLQGNCKFGKDCLLLHRMPGSAGGGGGGGARDEEDGGGRGGGVRLVEARKRGGRKGKEGKAKVGTTGTAVGGKGKVVVVSAEEKRGLQPKKVEKGNKDEPPMLSPESVASVSERHIEVGKVKSPVMNGEVQEGRRRVVSTPGSGGMDWRLAKGVRTVAAGAGGGQGEEGDTGEKGEVRTNGSATGQVPWNGGHGPSSSSTSSSSAAVAASASSVSAQSGRAAGMLSPGLAIPTKRDMCNYLTPHYARYSSSSHPAPISSPSYNHLLMRLTYGDTKTYEQSTEPLNPFSSSLPADVGEDYDGFPSSAASSLVRSTRCYLPVPSSSSASRYGRSFDECYPVHDGLHEHSHSHQHWQQRQRNQHHQHHQHQHHHLHEDDDGDVEDDGQEHNILPSSLNDLLTPAEQLKFSSSFTRESHAESYAAMHMASSASSSVTTTTPAAAAAAAVGGVYLSGQGLNGVAGLGSGQRGAAGLGVGEFNKAPGSPTAPTPDHLSTNTASRVGSLGRMRSPTSDVDNLFKRLAETKLSNRITETRVDTSSLHPLMVPDADVLVSPHSVEDAWVDEGPFFMETEESNTTMTATGLAGGAVVAASMRSIRDARDGAFSPTRDGGAVPRQPDARIAQFDALFNHRHQGKDGAPAAAAAAPSAGHVLAVPGGFSSATSVSASVTEVSSSSSGPSTTTTVSSTTPHHQHLRYADAVTSTAPRSAPNAHPNGATGRGKVVQSLHYDDGERELEPLCPFALGGGVCRYGKTCRYLHGLECPSCGRLCLHPHADAGEHQAHISECLEKTARSRTQQMLVESSRDVECAICLEPVLSTRCGRFGLLNCAHPFCLSCIKSWRAKGDLNARGCPLCRTVTYFVTPSYFWITEKGAKERVIHEYKQNLARIPCKNWNYGDGECQFGTSCFYSHKYRDGTEASRTPRTVLGADDVHVLTDIKISDFLVGKLPR